MACEGADRSACFAASMRRLVQLALLLAVLPTLLTACASECRMLNEKLCDCRWDTSIERQACYANVRSVENELEPTQEDQTACGEALENPACTCEALDTPEGKIACGLANDRPAIQDPAAE